MNKNQIEDFMRKVEEQKIIFPRPPKHVRNYAKTSVKFEKKSPNKLGKWY